MQTNDGIRINKYLSEHGICSRREADRYLEEGRIRINGAAAQMGQKIQEGDRVELDGRVVGETRRDPEVLLAFHKPRGIICSTVSKDHAENIVDYIHYPYRIFPIGRLDKDSEGLILMTNRGSLVNAVNRSVNFHEKEYLVRCRDRISDEFLRRMSEGVEIRIPTGETEPKSGRDICRSVRTRRCRVSRVDAHSFDIVLTQGLNRQIRRMCEALGNKVTDLKRIRIMNIELGELREGEHRLIEGAELQAFESLLK